MSFYLEENILGIADSLKKKIKSYFKYALIYNVSKDATKKNEEIILLNEVRVLK
jgi:hypothetical protein